MLKLMTRAEVAEYLDTSRNYLDQLASKGKGPPFFRTGAKSVRYDRDQLAAWLADRAGRAIARTAA